MGLVAAVYGFALVIVFAALVTFRALPRGSISMGNYSKWVWLTGDTLFAVGIIVSLFWPAVGIVVTVVAAAALSQVAYSAYGWQGWLVGIALLGTAALLQWLAWSPGTGTSAAVTLVIAAVLGIGASVAVRWGFRSAFGPNHPQSPLPGPPDSALEWMWTGAVTVEGAVVVARTKPGSGKVRLALGKLGSDPKSMRRIDPEAEVDRIARFRLTGLTPSTDYALIAEVDGSSARSGSFTTFPQGQASVRVAFASCAFTGSNGQVFDAIAAARPHLFCHLGDLHYENIGVPDRDAMLDAYERVLTAPAQARLYQFIPVAYVWDDHDFGDNNADASAPSRQTVRRLYRDAVPHYPLAVADGAGPIYQSFSIGRVRFLLTDNRSERVPSEGLLLSEEQEGWLIDEINSAAGHYPLVVWGSPTPWIGNGDIRNFRQSVRAGVDRAIPNMGAPGDIWAAFPEQRQRIAEAIAGSGVNLLLVSGDAHMVAIDDGSNNTYGGRDGGFPVMNAASLDRRGSEKGGPYSEGQVRGAGQFGLVEVTDNGSDLSVRLSGRNWKGAELVSYEFTVPGNAGGGK